MIKVEHVKDAVRDPKTNAILYEQKRTRHDLSKDKYINMLERRLLRLEARVKKLEDK